VLRKIDSVSIIVPTFNEAENISDLLDALLALPGDYSTEVVVVDDNSPDGTSSIVEKYVAGHAMRPGRTVRLHTRVGERGLSSAVLAGVADSSGKVIVVMDADFSHPPDLIPKMVDILRDDQYNLVVASRHLEGGGTKGWSLRREVTSGGATRLARLLGVKVTDPMSGFFAFDRSIVDGVKFDALGYKILLEILVRCHDVRVKEVPFTFLDRRAGKSKYDTGVTIDYVKSVWKLYRYRHRRKPASGVK